MASRVQRFLARVDQFVHEFFKMQRDETHGLYIYKNYPWGHWGRRCAIIDQNGRVIRLGYSWTVRHEYDTQGVLVSRLRMKQLAGPTDKVLYGRAADQAWDRDQYSRVPLTGGFDVD